MPEPSGSIRSSRIHCGRFARPRTASAMVDASNTAKPCRFRIAAIAFRAERSSSTISTDDADDADDAGLEHELEAASLGRSPGEADVSADVVREAFADRQSHAEPLAS